MKVGPKPTPSNLRMIETARSRFIADREPLPPATDLPEPPEWLAPLAREEWERLATDLWRMNVLTGVDLSTFAAYCEAYAGWRKATADLLRAQRLAHRNPQDKTSGAALAETTNGNLVQNPLIGIVNKARNDMLRLAVEFGLSPSSRTLIDAGRRGEEDPAARKHFGR